MNVVKRLGYDSRSRERERLRESTSNHHHNSYYGDEDDDRRAHHRHVTNSDRNSYYNDRDVPVHSSSSRSHKQDDVRDAYRGPSRERERSKTSKHPDDYASTDKTSSHPRKRCLAGGEWEEHLSSSNKVYYYNRVTGVSQWHKPKQVIDLENSLNHRNRSHLDVDDDRRHRDHRRTGSSKSPVIQDKYHSSQERHPRESDRLSLREEDVQPEEEEGHRRRRSPDLKSSSHHRSSIPVNNNHRYNNSNYYVEDKYSREDDRSDRRRSDHRTSSSNNNHNHHHHEDRHPREPDRTSFRDEEVDMELEEGYARSSRRSPDRDLKVSSHRHSSNHVNNNHNKYHNNSNYHLEDRYSRRIEEEEVDRRRSNHRTSSSNNNHHHQIHSRSNSVLDRDSVRSTPPESNGSNDRSPVIRDRYYESWRDRESNRGSRNTTGQSNSRVESLKRRREDEDTRSVTPCDSRSLKRRTPDRVTSSYKNHHQNDHRYEDRRNNDYHHHRSSERYPLENGRVDKREYDRDRSPRDDRKRRHYASTPSPTCEVKESSRTSVVRVVDETTQQSSSSVIGNDLVNHNNGTSSGSRSQCLSPSQVTMDNLEQIIDSLSDNPELPDLRKLSREDALKTIQQVLKIMKEASLGVLKNNQKPLPSVVSPSSSSSQRVVSGSSRENNHQKYLSNNNNNRSSAQNDSSVNGSVFINRQDLAVQSPSSDISGYSRSPSPGDSGVDIPVPSKPVVPSLTTTLSSCYREEMIKHVQGWQAEHPERQVRKR